MARIAVQCASLGVPSVLDLGFTRAEQRARFGGIAREAGFPVQLHHTDLPAATRISAHSRRSEPGRRRSRFS
jgi:predicted kinase